MDRTAKSRRGRKAMVFSIFDWFGTALAIVLIVIGQLVWIPDTLKLFGLHWIEILDYAIAAAALPLLLWTASSVIHLASMVKERNREDQGKVRIIATVALRIAVLIGACTSLVLALAAPGRLIAMSAAAAAAFAAMLTVYALDRRRRNRALFVLLIMAGLLYPTSYMVTTPGLTVPMNKYAAAETGKADGEILGVLVFERPAFPVDWLYSRLFSAYTFTKRTKDDPPLGEQLRVVRAMKLDADEVGSAVAFKKAGIGTGYRTIGVRIAALSENSPAEGRLQPGDIVIGLNGATVRSVDELVRRMDEVVPGEIVRLKLLRDEDELHVEMRAGAHPDTSEKAVLGIHIQNEIELDLPLRIDYESFALHEGGPSHGAMLALALIDQLTPEGVTYGNVVAGTGTISVDGEIGPIGGIRQKAYIVERKGADVFFVPEGQEEDARKGAKRLNIVPVRHIDDILAWLKAHPK